MKECVPNVYCGSQVAIHLSKNSAFHERTKHIDVRLHFVRDIIAQQHVLVQKIALEINPADMMTKPMPMAKFEQALACLKLFLA